MLKKKPVDKKPKGPLDDDGGDDLFSAKKASDNLPKQKESIIKPEPAKDLSPSKESKGSDDSFDELFKPAKSNFYFITEFSLAV